MAEEVEPYYRFVKGKGWLCGYWKEDKEDYWLAATRVWAHVPNTIFMMPRTVMYMDNI